MHLRISACEEETRKIIVAPATIFRRSAASEGVCPPWFPWCVVSPLVAAREPQLGPHERVQLEITLSESTSATLGVK